MLGYKYYTEPSYHQLSDDVHSLAELARLPDPTISPARDRHEWQWHILPGNGPILQTSIITLLPLPWLRVFAPEPPGDTWSGMKEFKGKGRTSPHVVIVSFFVSTPCPARRKSHTTIKKRNMRKDREQRAVIGRTLFACNNMQHRSLEVYLTYPLFGTCLSKNPDYLYCMHNTPYRGWLKKEKLNSFNASSKGRQAGSCRDKEPDATLLARNNFNKVFFYSSFLIRRRLCYQ